METLEKVLLLFCEKLSCKCICSLSSAPSNCCKTNIDFFVLPCSHTFFTAFLRSHETSGRAEEAGGAPQPGAAEAKTDRNEVGNWFPELQSPINVMQLFPRHWEKSSHRVLSWTVDWPFFLASLIFQARRGEEEERGGNDETQRAGRAAKAHWGLQTKLHGQCEHHGNQHQIPARQRAGNMQNDCVYSTDGFLFLLLLLLCRESRRWEVVNSALVEPSTWEVGVQLMVYHFKEQGCHIWRVWRTNSDIMWLHFELQHLSPSLPMRCLATLNATNCCRVQCDRLYPTLCCA